MQKVKVEVINKMDIVVVIDAHAAIKLHRENVKIRIKIECPGLSLRSCHQGIYSQVDINTHTSLVSIMDVANLIILLENFPSDTNKNNLIKYLSTHTHMKCAYINH